MLRQCIGKSVACKLRLRSSRDRTKVVGNGNYRRRFNSDVVPVPTRYISRSFGGGAVGGGGGGGVDGGGGMEAAAGGGEGGGGQRGNPLTTTHKQARSMRPTIESADSRRPRPRMRVQKMKYLVYFRFYLLTADELPVQNYFIFDSP
jgi:hypothetical protein